MKNPQTSIAPTFLTHIIFAIGGVSILSKKFKFAATIYKFKNKSFRRYFF